MRTCWRTLIASATGMLMVVTGFGVIGTAGPAGAASSAAPIKIGDMCSCTGPLASSTATAPPAYEAWAKYENAHGGLNGHQIQVINEDDDFNPATSVSEVQKLVAVDHVAAIVDGSDVDAAWASYVEQQGVPVIGGNSSSDEFLTNPDFFSVGETLDDWFINYIDDAKKVGAKNIAQFYCTESVTCEQAVPFLKKAAAAEHFPVVYTTAISASAPSYSAQCIAAKQAGVQAIDVADAVSVVLAVASDCKAQGYTPWQIAIDGSISKSFTSAPGVNNYVIGSMPDIPFWVNNTPATKLMNSEIKKYASSALNSPNWNEDGTQLYASGLLLAAAVKAADAGKSGPITSAEILKGLYSLHNETLGGIAPPLNYKKGKPNPVDCWYWIRVQHGKLTTPYGLKPDCVPPPAGS